MKLKMQVCWAVTAQLISAFVFVTLIVIIVQSLFLLNLKFQASSHLLWLYRCLCDKIVSDLVRNPEDRMSLQHSSNKSAHAQQKSCLILPNFTCLYKVFQIHFNGLNLYHVSFIMSKTAFCICEAANTPWLISSFVFQCPDHIIFIVFKIKLCSLACSARKHLCTKVTPDISTQHIVKMGEIWGRNQNDKTG